MTSTIPGSVGFKIRECAFSDIFSILTLNIVKKVTQFA
jgi:hypothetical protein